MVKITDVSELADLKEFIELEVLDNKIDSILLKLKGRTLKISKDYYGSQFQILKEQEEQKDLWLVHGNFLGVTDIDKTFEEEYDARKYYNDLIDKAGFGGHTLEIGQITVTTNGSRI